MARRKNPEDCCSNREVIYITDREKEFAALFCHERNMSFSAYSRLAFKYFRQYIETELSKRKQGIDSPKMVTVSAQNPLNQNGFCTVEQVAQLINAMREGK